jgi:hypothetical protein
MGLLSKFATNSAMKQILLCVSLTAILTVAANASIITWQTVQTISGSHDVSTLGTLVGTWAPYVEQGFGTAQTVNGVTFAGDSLTGLNYSTYNGYSYDGFGNPGTADSGYNNLLGAGQWAYSGPANFSFGGLTVGDSYQVQIWVEDLRSPYISRTETFAASGPPDASGTLTYGYGGYGQYVIGTFVASSTSEQIDAQGGVPQVNLFQLRELPVTPVPEPSTMIAGAMLLLPFGTSAFRQLRKKLQSA